MTWADVKTFIDIFKFLNTNQYLIPIIVALGIVIIGFIVLSGIGNINKTIEKKVDELKIDIKGYAKEYIDDKIDYIKDDISCIRKNNEIIVDNIDDIKTYVIDEIPLIKEFVEERKILKQKREVSVNTSDITNLVKDKVKEIIDPASEALRFAGFKK